ncbi:hypothetical protein TNCV_3284931 [Trichonephila clavipes]|nr:hypothetical protein TNCV_3284931 [Trichonephila clavipes]
MWYQYNGASPHYGIKVREKHLNVIFAQRLIDRGGQVYWPARLPEFPAPVSVLHFNKMLSVPLMCCYFCSFSLLICTIARNYGICDPAFLSDSESSLYPLHTLKACRFCSELLYVFKCSLDNYNLNIYDLTS